VDAEHAVSAIHQVVVASPPLFHYLLHIFVTLFGRNDFWLRFPSAFIGIVTIPLAYLAMADYFGPDSAFWTTLLWAVCPLHVVYSHELRMYSLVALEALGCVYFWSRALETDRVQDWVFFGLSLLLGLYTHNWFLFLCVSLAMGFLVAGLRQKKLSRNGMAAFGVVTLLYLPWLPWLKKQVSQDLFNFLVAPWWYHLQVTLEAFAGGRVPSGHSFVQAVPWARIALGFLSAGCLLYGLFKPGPTKKKALPIFIFGGLLPVALAYVTALLFKPVYHGSRYTIIALPAIFFAVARCFEPSERKGGRWPQLAAVALILLWIKPLSHFFTTYQKAPWKDLGAWINERITPDDAILYYKFHEVHELALDYYVLPNANRVKNFSPPGRIKRLFFPVLESDIDGIVKTLPASWTIGQAYHGDKIFSLLLIRKNN
jgi:uncharacterized membrane protein